MLMKGDDIADLDDIGLQSVVLTSCWINLFLIGFSGKMPSLRKHKPIVKVVRIMNHHSYN